MERFFGDFIMLYNYSFDIAALLVLVLIYVISITLYKIRSKVNSYFHLFVYWMIVSTILDLLSAATISYAQYINVQLNMLICGLYHFSITMATLFAFSYIASCVHFNNKFMIITNAAMMSLYILILLVNQFTGIIFKLENNVLEHGKFYLLIYVFPGYYFIFGCIILFVFRKLFNSKTFFIHYCFIVVPFSLFVIQTINSYLLLTCFAGSLIALLMMFALERPDEIRAMEMEKIFAERANKSKTDFFIKMSHEIRTPVNTIVGMNEVILRESNEPEVRKHAMDIKTSVDTLQSLINDILDFSKIESGTMAVTPVNYNLEDILYEVINLTKLKADDKGLRFHVDVQSDIPRTYFGDDLKVKQILTNLLTNAVKYTKSGTVTLNITGEKDDTASNEKLLFEVIDTGIGIKEEHIPLIMQNYTRVDNINNRYIEGTGLGLNIVNMLLEKMNSQLKVESIYGKGSVFYFTLNQKIIDDQSIGDIMSKFYNRHLKYEYKVSFIAPSAKILLVDDNSLNRKVFIELLKKQNMQIMDVESGERALKMVENIHFDLIFMDHMMPNLDGIETIHCMQQQQQNLSKDTPVIALTANAIENAKETYLKEGFVDYLPKPIKPKKLENMLLKYLPESKIIQVSEDYHEHENQNAHGEESKEEKEPVLPELEDFDWNIAKKYYPDTHMLLETLPTIYEYLLKCHDELDKYFSNILVNNNLRYYKICTHTLKSTMNSVGAVFLSNIAKICEFAAENGQIERIQVLHAFLIEELIKHSERLSVFKAPNKNKKEISDKDLYDFLDNLQKTLEDFDYKRADIGNEILKNSIISDKFNNDVSKLCTQITELKTQAALDTIKEIKNKLGNIDEKDINN